VLVNGRERRKAEPSSDFLETRRVAMLLNEFLEVVQDLSLTLRKWLHAQTPGDGLTEPGLYTKKRRKSTSVHIDAAVR
jgi:hypothetical protein